MPEKHKFHFGVNSPILGEGEHEPIGATLERVNDFPSDLKKPAQGQFPWLDDLFKKNNVSISADWTIVDVLGGIAISAVELLDKKHEPELAPENYDITFSFSKDASDEPSIAFFIAFGNTTYSGNIELLSGLPRFSIKAEKRTLLEIERESLSGTLFATVKTSDYFDFDNGNLTARGKSALLSGFGVKEQVRETELVPA